MTSGTMPCASSILITPMWAKPRAAPPPRARPIFGLAAGVSGALAGSSEQPPSAAAKPPSSSRRRWSAGSDIGFDQSAVLLHPGPAAGGFALAHQQREGGGHLLDCFAVGLERHQAAGVRAERGFPELVRVHFAKTLEAGDGDLVFRNAFVGQLLQRLFLFGLIQAIDLAGVAARLDIDAEQGRLGDMDVST